MKTIKTRLTRHFFKYGLFAALSGLSFSVMAGGFQLSEENVSEMGNAYAGVGATAEDASTEFYNPAGMALIKNPQLVVAGSLLDINVKANVDSASTYNSAVVTPISSAANVTTSVTGTNNVQAGARAPIPALHFVYPLERFAFGIGLTAPFGLETDYPEDAITRFMATESKLQDIDLSPSVSFEVTQQFSVGVGLDAQYASATLDQHANVLIPPILFPPINNPALVEEANFTNEGSAWGYGWNAGMLYQFTPTTRMGLTYRSRTDFNLVGDANLSILNLPSTLSAVIPAVSPGTVSANLGLPDSADISLYHDFNPQWAMMGGVDYTHWSMLQNITLNYSGPVSSLVQSVTLPLAFRDTLRYSLGANYRPTNKWTLRTGVAFDESPVKSADTRTFRLPDSNRLWLALGAQYQINHAFTVDAGYAHIFIADSRINQTISSNGLISSAIPYFASSTATGGFNSSVNEFGLQLTWNFA